jgi:hypothetical protein
VPGFERDIKPLFRDSDRAAMDFVLDLWDYEQVKADAALVLERVEDGSMPCDEPWPPEQVDLLRGWVDDGCPP